MTKEEILAASLTEANTIKTYTESCPRHTLNPGIYFGFVEGAKWILQQLEKHENNKTNVNQN